MNFCNNRWRYHRSCFKTLEVSQQRARDKNNICEQKFSMYHLPRSTNRYRCEDVESLVTLSTRVVANIIACDASQVGCLPEELKSVLVKLLARRNKLTLQVLRFLVHKNLTSIQLHGQNCTDVHLKALVICKNLEDLHIPEARVTNTGLSELFQWLPHLHTLDVSSSAAIDDSVLKSLSNHCPALRLLNIGKCPGFTDQGLLHVSQNCFCLSVLDISYTNVTNQSIKFIGEGCFRSILTELHIDGCQFLTSECGNYLSNLSRVSMLSFYDCPSLLESDWFQSFSGGQGKIRVKNISFTV